MIFVSNIHVSCKFWTTRKYVRLLISNNMHIYL